MAASALGAAVLLTGCAASRLSSQPPPGERLAGDWKLDVAGSDDLGKAVEELRAQLANARRDRGSGGPEQEVGSDPSHRPGGGQGVGIGPAVGTSPVDELMSNIPRGDYLRITVSPSAFTVISGDSTEEYTPGLESDISAEQGDAQQISGWKGADYVIDTKPRLGAEMLQSYTLTKDGRLMLTMRLTGSGTKFTFNRVYDRTTGVAPLAPPTNN